MRARLVVPPSLEERAVAALWDAGCLGVQVAGPGPARRLTLDAFYPGQAGRRRLSVRLRRSLLQAGLRVRPALAAVRPGDWVGEWQRSLRPMAIGRFLVVPEGRRVPPARGRHVIRVRFGQAFGTGEHASTRLCLRLLPRHLSPGARVLDLGTGSGILAMAACRLGAGRVLAAADDRVALAVARRNLADNLLARRVALRRADAARACRPGPFDAILVNIGAATIERLLPDLAAALSPEGRAILSGLLIDDEKRLLAVAAPLGLRPVGRRRSSPWSALVLGRRPRYNGRSSPPGRPRNPIDIPTRRRGVPGAIGAGGAMEICIRNSDPADVPSLIELCQRVYPGMAPWRPEQLESQIRVFPDGQIVAVTPDGRIAGMASSLILFWDDYDPLGSWKDFTGGGFFTNHDPDKGRTLYGAEICVDRECRGQQLGRRLYDARKSLCRRLNLRRMRAGGRIPGYHALASRMTAEEYVQKVMKGEVHDPTLTFQLRNGFRVLQVVPSYLRGDRHSMEYATLIEWLNPDYREDRG